MSPAEFTVTVLYHPVDGDRAAFIGRYRKHLAKQEVKTLLNATISHRVVIPEDGDVAGKKVFAETVLIFSSKDHWMNAVSSLEGTAAIADAVSVAGGVEGITVINGVSH